MIRVLVVDDQALLRTAFRTLIDAEPDLTVVGEAADGGQAVEMAASARPDVVVMDVRMPVLDGIAATARIRAVPTGRDTSGPSSLPRVLILTTFDLDEYVYEALRAGASGFVLKSGDLDDLLAAIRVVADGEALLAPSVTTRLIRQVVLDRRARPDGAHADGERAPSGHAARPPSIHALATLTGRELDVLRLVAQGLTNAEIAERLHVSIPTAKTHVSRLLLKLDARDRVQLVIVAYECGLVVPEA